MPHEIQVQVGPTDAPATYTLAPGQAFITRAGTATFRGVGASGDFWPCLSFYAANGSLISRCKAEQVVTAGDSAEVTFGPFLRGTPTAVASGGGFVTADIVFTEVPTIGVYTLTASLPIAVDTWVVDMLVNTYAQWYGDGALDAGDDDSPTVYFNGFPIQNVSVGAGGIGWPNGGGWNLTGNVDGLLGIPTNTPGDMFDISGYTWVNQGGAGKAYPLGATLVWSLVVDGGDGLGAGGITRIRVLALPLPDTIVNAQ